MSHIDQSAFRRIADSLPTPTASIAPKAEGEAVASAGFASVVWAPEDEARLDAAIAARNARRAAPVAQAAAGASEDVALWKLVYGAIMGTDRRPVSIADFDAAAKRVADMIERRAALSPRPSADADRASGGAVEALRELLWAIQTEIPPFEAGHEAQEAWSTRRLAARNNAAAILRATPTTKD